MRSCASPVWMKSLGGHAVPAEAQTKNEGIVPLPSEAASAGYFSRCRLDGGQERWHGMVRDAHPLDFIE
jgi:hypothetical protein